MTFFDWIYSRFKGYFSNNPIKWIVDDGDLVVGEKRHVRTFHVNLVSDHKFKKYSNSYEMQQTLINYILNEFEKDRSKFIVVILDTPFNRIEYSISDSVYGLMRSCEMANVSEYEIVAGALSIINRDDPDDILKLAMIQSLTFLMPYNRLSIFQDGVIFSVEYLQAQRVWEMVGEGKTLTMMTGPAVHFLNFEGYESSAGFALHDDDCIIAPLTLNGVVVLTRKNDEI